MAASARNMAGWMLLLVVSLCVSFSAAHNCTGIVGISASWPSSVNSAAVFFVCGDAHQYNDSVYVWSFGDGSSLTTHETEVEHVYAAVGIYEVSVNATYGPSNMTERFTSDARIYDCSINATRDGQDLIITKGKHAPNSPILFWACLPEEDVGPNDTVSYSWDFGDGIIPLPLDPRNQVMSHTFNSSGTFNITLRALISSATVEDREVFFKKYIVTSTPQPGRDDDDGLSGGTIAGIVVGIVVGTVLFTVGAAMALKHARHLLMKKRNTRHSNIGQLTSYQLLTEEDV